PRFKRAASTAGPTATGANMWMIGYDLRIRKRSPPPSRQITRWDHTWLRWGWIFLPRQWASSTRKGYSWGSMVVGTVLNPWATRWYSCRLRTGVRLAIRWTSWRAFGTTMVRHAVDP